LNSPGQADTLSMRNRTPGKCQVRPRTRLIGHQDAHSVKGEIPFGGPLVDLDSHSSKIVIK
jgi:hypothetical protein